MISKTLTKDNFRFFLRSYIFMVLIAGALIICIGIFVEHTQYTATGFIWFGSIMDVLKTIFRAIYITLLKAITFMPLAVFIFFGQIKTAQLCLKLGLSSQVTAETLPYWIFGLVYIPVKMLINYLIMASMISSIIDIPVPLNFAWVYFSTLPFVALEYYILGYLIWSSVYEKFIEPQLQDSF